MNATESTATSCKKQFAESCDSETRTEIPKISMGSDWVDVAMAAAVGRSGVGTAGLTIDNTIFDASGGLLPRFPPYQ